MSESLEYIENKIGFTLCETSRDTFISNWNDGKCKETGNDWMVGLIMDDCDIIGCFTRLRSMTDDKVSVFEMSLYERESRAQAAVRWDIGE